MADFSARGYDGRTPMSGGSTPHFEVPSFDLEKVRRERDIAISQIYYDETMRSGRAPSTALEHQNIGYLAGYQQGVKSSYEIQVKLVTMLTQLLVNHSTTAGLESLGEAIEEAMQSTGRELERVRRASPASIAAVETVSNLAISRIEDPREQYGVQHGLKRKADSVNNESTSISSSSSSGAAHTSASLPKKAKSTHEQTTKSKAKASSSLAPLRRPTLTDKWYSDETTEVEWNKHNSTKKRQLSHIGYIEETNAGMFAPKPCSQCKHFTRYNSSTKKTEKLVCMVYKPGTSDKYTVKQSENWRSCSNCWRRGDDCGIVREAKDAAQARGDPMPASVARHYDDDMLTWYANTSKSRPERQPDGSVIFRKD